MMNIPTIRKSGLQRIFCAALSCLLLALTIPFHVSAQAANKTTIDDITRQSLYGNWPQYVPGDTIGGACGNASGGPVNLTVGKDFSLGTDPAGRRTNLMKALMADFGLAAPEAAGIVGNFMLESGGTDLPPNVNEGGRKGPPAFSGGYGWAQWTGPRQHTFIDYAVQNGYMASSQVDATDGANYAYLKQELTTGYASSIAAVKGQQTPETAADSFEKTYEAAGKPNLATREQFARQAFNEYSGVPAGTTAAGSNVSISTGGGACGQAGAQAACGDSVSCAKAILAAAAAGTIVLRSGSQQNLQTIADGQLLTVCPGAPVILNVTLLQLVLNLSQTYKLDIHNFSAPGHSCDQAFHPKGRATDVSLVGVPADCASLGSNPQNHAFAQTVMDNLPPGGGLGQKECIGALNNTAGKRYFDDSDQHFHIDVGASAP